MKMKNRKSIAIIWILLMIVGIMIVIVSAALLNSQRDIDDADVNIIKDKSNVTEIDIVITGKGCDSDSCLFRAYQEDVMNTIFIIDSKYTDEEMRIRVEDYIVKRLEDYADAIRERNARTDYNKIDGVVEIR